MQTTEHNTDNLSVSSNISQTVRYEFVPDDDPVHPFEDDEMVLVVSTMRNHAFGNTKMSDDDLLRLREEGWRVFPIRGYLHGSLALSAHKGGVFSCPWDSGWAGLIGFSPDISDPYPEEAIERLHKYLNGDVWTLLKLEGDEMVESVGDLYSVEDAVGEVTSEDADLVKAAWEARFETSEKRRG